MEGADAVMPVAGASAPVALAAAPIGDAKSDAAITGGGDPPAGAVGAAGADSGEAMARRNDLSITVADGKVVVRDGDGGHAAEYPEHMGATAGGAVGANANANTVAAAPAPSPNKTIPRGAEINPGALFTFDDMLQMCAARIRLVQAASAALLAMALALLILSAMAVQHRTAALFQLAAYGLLVTGALGCVSAPLGAWGAGRIRLGLIDAYLLVCFALSAAAILFGITAFTTTSSALSDRASAEYDKSGDVQSDYSDKTAFTDAAQTDLNRLKVIGVLTIPVAVALVVFALRLRSTVKRAVTTMQHQTERVAATQQRRALRDHEIEKWEAARNSPLKKAQKQPKRSKAKRAARYAAEADADGDESEPVDVEAGRGGGTGGAGGIDDDGAMTGAGPQPQPQPHESPAPAPRRKKSSAAAAAAAGTGSVKSKQKKKTRKSTASVPVAAASPVPQIHTERRARAASRDAVAPVTPGAAVAATPSHGPTEPTELAPLPRPASS